MKNVRFEVSPWSSGSGLESSTLVDVGAYCPGTSTTWLPPPVWPPRPSRLAAANTACEFVLAAATADDRFALYSALSREESCWELDEVKDFDSHAPAQRSGACDENHDSDGETSCSVDLSGTREIPISSIAFHLWRVSTSWSLFCSDGSRSRKSFLNNAAYFKWNMDDFLDIVLFSGFSLLKEKNFFPSVFIQASIWLGVSVLWWVDTFWSKAMMECNNSAS